jgi:hypothetical protein
MVSTADPDREECPACSGTGGAPLEGVQQGWDIESYECVRCGGAGVVAVATAAPARPGIAKTTSTRPSVEKKRRSGA